MKLTDVIGKDFFIFEDRRYTDIDFQEMPLEELETFKARLNLKATDIADKIKARKKIEDPDWYTRRKYVLSLTTKMIPYINFAIKQRRKKDKSLGDYFMDRAKVLLPEQDFETILSDAGREMGLGAKKQGVEA